MSGTIVSRKILHFDHTRMINQMNECGFDKRQLRWCTKSTDHPLLCSVIHMTRPLANSCSPDTYNFCTWKDFRNYTQIKPYKIALSHLSSLFIKMGIKSFFLAEWQRPVQMYCEVVLCTGCDVTEVIWRLGAARSPFMLR